MPFMLASNLVLRSRLGLVKFRMRTTSYAQKSAFELSSRHRNMEGTYLACQFILLNTSKVQQIVKVEAGKLCFPQYLMAEFTSAFHDSTKHLIIASTSEQDFARVELEECTPDGPDVNTKIIRHSQDCAIMLETGTTRK